MKLWPTQLIFHIENILQRVCGLKTRTSPALLCFLFMNEVHCFQREKNQTRVQQLLLPSAKINWPELLQIRLCRSRNDFESTSWSPPWTGDKGSSEKIQGYWHICECWSGQPIWSRYQSRFIFRLKWSSQDKESRCIKKGSQWMSKREKRAERKEQVEHRISNFYLWLNVAVKKLFEFHAFL